MTERHIHLVVEDVDPGALSADDLPVLPTRLPCAICGEPRSAHGPWSACPLFVRPALPTGPRLRGRPGGRFGLPLPRCRTSHLPSRASQRGPTGRFGPGLIQVEVSGQPCGATAYLLHEATVVHVEE